MVIRRGGPSDVRFLRDMLHHAYYWRERDPGEGPGPVALYVKGWGRPGDTALIAIDEGFPVGAAWYRLFRREQPGYGFVDEETPELAIAVVPSRRGRGIGDALLKALYERAKQDGHAAVSLAAERDNAPLVSYYENKHGFQRVHEDGSDSVTMRREL
jgi:ribosomal protein S18 acetylase RimI-like enzyme